MTMGQSVCSQDPQRALALPALPVAVLAAIDVRVFAVGGGRTELGSTRCVPALNAHGPLVASRSYDEANEVAGLADVGFA